MSESETVPATPFAVFCGLDVGKSEHHACAVDTAGRRLHDKALPNDETALRSLFARLGEHGQVLVVVDQPASIGALAVTVARELGVEVATYRGWRCAGSLTCTPGQSKTDARDAHVIAEAARTMPHTLRRIRSDDEALAELGVLAGYDDDLASQSTRLSNRLRDALLHVHPALERLLGPRLDRAGVLELLAAAPTPAALAELGAEGMTELMAPRSPRLARTLPTQILAALEAQTLVVAGTGAFARVISGIAGQLRDVHDERAALAAELEARLPGPPSWTGRGPRCPDSGSGPPSNCSPSSATVPRSPPPRTWRLRRARRLADPDSRAYYDRKRAAGKRHNAAVICLARRRTDVIYAMLRDRQPYRANRPPPQHPSRLDSPIATPPAGVVPSIPARLGRGEAQDVPQQQGRALARREVLEGGDEGEAHGLALRGHVTRVAGDDQAGVRHRLDEALRRQRGPEVAAGDGRGSEVDAQGPTARAAEQVQAHRRRDPEDPRTQRAPGRVVPLEVAVRADDGLLHRVLGVRRGAEHAVAVRPQRDAQHLEVVDARRGHRHSPAR